MRERHAARQRRRAQEFEAFVAGAAGRLLHTAALLTTEPARPTEPAEQAGRLLTAALARTYADWDRLRGEDPYDRTRQDLATHFARTARHRHGSRGGVLSGLTPQERLVLVLLLYEGVEEEQTAALLGLPVDRVSAICARAVATTHRRTDGVRRMLEGPHPQVPAGLALRAAERGSRLLRRRRALNRLFTWAMWTAVAVFLVWAAVNRPWVDPPAGTTPPLDGW